ncbi:PTS lactose/cellobiose transporter subunit IIA [Streptococcus sp. S784/96/1]|uniref:PTS lactose/cellobiose transporter subunit IIA n=1 Tax=Streptococcus sp. S784/96/1 TaxID=2653499 RepID=UPI001389FD1F|nr:PTS lactose/cellobiose transporter subunit IIA [Streptococcus sp. S784/96/1]
MEGIELSAFQIIANVGSARSAYIEAIQEAKTGNFDKAINLISEGDKAFVEGHHSHSELIQKEASSEGVEMKLILMHAEDQLMSAEAFKIIAQEFIDVYKQLAFLKQ